MQVIPGTYLGPAGQPQMPAAHGRVRSVILPELVGSLNALAKRRVAAC